MALRVSWCGKNYNYSMKMGERIFPLYQRNYKHIFSAHQTAAEAVSSYRTRGQTVGCWSTPLCFPVLPGPVKVCPSLTISSGSFLDVRYFSSWKSAASCTTVAPWFDWWTGFQCVAGEQCVPTHSLTSCWSWPSVSPHNFPDYLISALVHVLMYLRYGLMARGFSMCTSIMGHPCSW